VLRAMAPSAGRGAAYKATLRLHSSYPRPLVGFADETGLDGVVFDVSRKPIRRLRTTTPMVETFGHPESALPAQDAIGLSRCESLNAAERVLQRRRRIPSVDCQAVHMLCAPFGYVTHALLARFL